MPRLPDSAEMGVRNAASGRPIATIDQTAIGAGVASLGRGIGSLASDLASVARKQDNEAVSLEDATARSNWLTNKVKLDEERDNLNDPDALEKHKPLYRSALEQSASVIKDQTRRERFILDNAPTVETASVAVNNRSFNIKKDKFLAESQTELDGLREAGLKSQDEGERTKIIDAGRAKIDALKDNGYISEVQAASMKKRWIENYAVSKLEMMRPEERMAALSGDIKPTQAAKSAFDFFTSKGWTPVQAAGIIGNLMQESSMNSRARNAGDGSDGTDSIGVGQWNSDRAVRLKKYAASRGTDWHDLQTQLEFVDLELRTSEGKAGQMLTSAKDVRSATAAMVMYERPRGSNRGAEHADGWANRLRHAQTFAQSYAGGPAPERPRGIDIASVLPSDTRQQMFNQARSQYTSDLNKKDYEFRQEIQSVKNLITDDINSIRMTGKPVAELTPERIESTHGREAAQEWSRERTAAQTYYNTTKDFASMTNEQIMSSIETVRPQGGEEGFSQQASNYDAIQKEARRVMKMREDDPAGAVANDPGVQRAMEEAKQTGSYEGVVKARMLAQKTIGVPDHRMSPVPAVEIEGYTKALRQMSEGQASLVDQRKTAETISQDMVQRYGSYADTVLKRALYNLTLSDSSAAIMQKVFKSAMDGKPVALNSNEQATITIAGREQAYQQARNPRVMLPLMGTGSIGQPGDIGPSMTQPGTPQPTFAPPKSHVEALLQNANPETKQGAKWIADFDAMYGRGAAFFYLKQARESRVPNMVVPEIEGTGLGGVYNDLMRGRGLTGKKVPAA